MAVPDFQSLMLPLLRVASDGQEHPLAEARDALAKEFRLSTPDLEELLPSGRQSSSRIESLGQRAIFSRLGCSCPRAEDTSKRQSAAATS